MRHLAAVLCGVLLISCGGNPNAPGSSISLSVGPGAAYRTIQSAVDAAPSGATINVSAGTYSEHVVISKALAVRGNQAILDGMSGGLDGRYLGFEVKSSGVEVSGFVVQNFERGIVLDHVSNCRVLRNEVRNNTSKDPQPISPGVTKSDGIVLFQVQDSEISDNFIHDNGSIGLMVVLSSGGNTIRRNRVVNNGTQQAALGGFEGAGIQTGGGNNTRNEITDNEVSDNDWGISLRASPDSANIVKNNRVHGNRRSGILVYGQHNVIESNDATGNSILHLVPSCGFDLLEFDVIDNTWTNNTGTFGTFRAFVSWDTCP